jgi:hypothetical protein
MQSVKGFHVISAKVPEIKKMSGIEEFVSQLKLSNYNFDNSINIRCLDLDGKARFEHKYNLKDPQSLDQLSKLFKGSLNNAWHYYYVPNNSNGFTINDVVNTQILFVEFDDIPKEEQFKKVKELGIPFTYCVETFKSIHFYWTLLEPLDINTWISYQKQLIERLGSDKSICNPNRLMRMAGMPYADKGFNVNLIKNFKDSDSNKKVDLSLFNFTEPLPVDNISKNKIDKSTLLSLRYGQDCPISDLIQQSAECIEDLFNWDGHNFKSDGKGKFKGYCPWHESNSGTAFWVEQNEYGCYSFACPQCTDNKKKNLLYYRNRLKGNDCQPKGKELEIIESEIYTDIFGKDMQVTVDMSEISNQIANVIKSNNLIEVLSNIQSFENFANKYKIEGTEGLDIEILYKQVNSEYIKLEARGINQDLDFNVVPQMLSDEEFKKLPVDQQNKILESKVKDLAVRESEIFNLDRKYIYATTAYLKFCDNNLKESLKYDGVEFTSENVLNDTYKFINIDPLNEHYIEYFAKIWNISDIKYFKRKIEDLQEELAESKEDIDRFASNLFNEDSNVKYLIPNKIALSNLTMFGSDPGSGKSLLMGDLVLAVLQPDTKSYLGEKSLLPSSDVLYINNDEAVQSLSNRLLSMGLDKNLCLPENKKFHYYDGIFDLKNEIYKIEKQILKINKIGDCKLVVIDSLTSVTQDGESDENHPSFAKPLVKLSALAERYGCAIVLLHHTNKLGALSGTNRLTSACHQVYILGKTKKTDDDSIENDPYRILKCVKNRTGILFSNRIEINPKSLWKQESAYVLSQMERMERGMYENAIENTFVKNITNEIEDDRSELVSYEDLHNNNKGLQQTKIHHYIEELTQRNQLAFDLFNFKFESKGKFRENIFKQAESKLGSTLDLDKIILSKKELENLADSEKSKDLLNYNSVPPNEEIDILSTNEVVDYIETVIDTSDKIELFESVSVESKQVEDNFVEINTSEIEEFLELNDSVASKELDFVNTVGNRIENDKESSFFNYVMPDGRKLKEHVKDSQESEHILETDLNLSEILSRYKPWMQLNTEFKIYKENSPEFLTNVSFLQHSKKLFIDCLNAFDIYTIMNVEKSSEFESHISKILDICRSEKIQIFESYTDFETEDLE